MKIKMEVLVEAVKRIIEAGNEGQLKEISRNGNLFVTVNKSVAKQVKSKMVKSTIVNSKGADHTKIKASLAEFDDCRT